MSKKKKKKAKKNAAQQEAKKAPALQGPKKATPEKAAPQQAEAKKADAKAAKGEKPKADKQPIETPKEKTISLPNPTKRRPLTLTKATQAKDTKEKKPTEGDEEGYGPFILQLSEVVYVRTFFILAGALLLLYLVFNLRSILTPVLLGAILAYVLNPLVDKIETWGISRKSAITTLVLTTSICIFFMLLLLLPALSRSITELGALTKKLPVVLTEVKLWLVKHAKIEIPDTWAEAFNMWGGHIKTYVPKAISPITSFVQSIFSSSYNMLIALFHLVLVPLFTFYFLKDYKYYRGQIPKYIPPRWRFGFQEKWNQIDRMISGFIRGQFTVSLSVGILYLALLAPLQAPMAPVFALGGAMLNVIPYAGFAITFFLTTIAALIEFQLQWQFFAIFIGMAGIHVLDVLFITPKVVGDQVGLSELTVIIAVLAGGKLFGFLGILLAVPATAAIKVGALELIRYYKKSDFYLGNTS